MNEFAPITAQFNLQLATGESVRRVPLEDAGREALVARFAESLSFKGGTHRA